MDAIRIEEVNYLNFDNITQLLNQSQEEGFRHIVRLVNDYLSGTNRFNKPGEALFIAFDEEVTVGICGLNLDPFTNGHVGRVRRLYVLPEYRNHGIGRRLIEEIIGKANDIYDQLVLKTDSEKASKFYKSLGFKEVNNSNSTHILNLKKSI
jgi:GNAT superfamily N-acetyltransferase